MTLIVNVLNMKTIPTILLVDDSPDTLALLGDFLEDVGYHVVYAEDGESAVQRAMSTNPQLILLDIRMQGMDGFMTCRTLKSLAHMREVPVLGMSTYYDQEILRKIRAAGGAGFVCKPFRLSSLLSTIQTHLPANLPQSV